MASEKFVDAFNRFEETVDVDRIESFRELKSEFASWAGNHWKNTSRQVDALADEARRLRIPVEGAPAVFSVKFKSFSSWREQSARSGAYQRRVQRYVIRHPHATLVEARGHRRR